MNLHNNNKLFYDTLRAASQHLNIKLEFVEKDYWITLVLNRLASSKYVSSAVFKGGTSLSKGYDLIDRFSEDVDLAIINNNSKSGNEIKNIIRSLEKEITADFSEKIMQGVTSKGSRFRKSVFEYSSSDKNNANNKLIVEINSFANPYPYQKIILKSLIYDFLFQTENFSYIDNSNLHPFEINILNKEQTLLEKLVSLIRFSFSENPIEGISGKIRHFYDLYFLSTNPECAEFISTDDFKKQFNAILQHDREMFDEPVNWLNKSIIESPLICEFEQTWNQIKGKYKTELTALAYRAIPDENEVAVKFIELTKRIV